MKNIIKILCVAVLLVSCGDFEPVVYDSVNGQTGIGFTTASSSVVVPQTGGVTATVYVQATNTSTSDRTFDVSVDEASTGSSADYTLGSLTIPAGSFEGSLDITFDNFDNLEDLVTYKLILNLALSSDVAVVGSSSTTINYLKYLICNDFTLTINEDGYGSERNWEITDASGTVVVSCADYGCPFNDVTGGEQNTADFTLADGCYTFTIYDSYGDGIYDGNVTGNYTLSCSIITHAYGEGNFGSSESTDFCVNQ